MRRRALTFSDRAGIATGLKARHGVRRIARDVCRSPSVVSREIRRNPARAGGRPGGGEPETVPDAAAGRRPVVRLEAADLSAGLIPGSRPAEGRTVSHEATCQWNYAMPKGELARRRTRRTRRTRRRRRRRRCPLGERTGGRIIGMVSIDDPYAAVAGRRVLGAREGDLIIGAAGQSAATTLRRPHPAGEDQAAHRRSRDAHHPVRTAPGVTPI